MKPRKVIFLFNLLQDVNVLRPLVHLASAQLGLTVQLLVSEKFFARDVTKTWTAELNQLASLVQSTMHTYQSEWGAFQLIQNGSGILIAGSESNLPVHVETHNVFRSAPSSYLRVTLQHGYECVGFLLNREQEQSYGKNLSMSADVLCGWGDHSLLTSMPTSQRSKLYVTGPSSLIPVPSEDLCIDSANSTSVGLVCENLHSVRLKEVTDAQSEFLQTFSEFCTHLEGEHESVVLKPHPGGQYVLKNNVTLPGNAHLNNSPIYKIALSAFEYGISAPSSVILDMLLADIPVAVWKDSASRMDTRNYEGLFFISSVADWIAFARDCKDGKAAFLDRQRAFVARKGLVADRNMVTKKFSNLLTSGADTSQAIVVAQPPVERILFVANAYIPTLQLSFLKPLAEDIANGGVEVDLLTEAEMLDRFGRQMKSIAAEDWIKERIAEFAPDQMVFCRYSGPHAKLMLRIAREQSISAIFHIDDDLLNIPKEIGEKKFKYHNKPERLDAVRTLLSEADLVYCSTEALRERLRSMGFRRAVTAGKVYCSASILNEAVLRPITKIGYMGFDHADDLELILPALVKVLRENAHIAFDLFGSIPKPTALDEFGTRIREIPPVRNYNEFLREFAKLHWDVGISPLRQTQFNSVKANTKWVEYSSVGAAVIASRGAVYDDCCSDGCGVLAATETEWADALTLLCTDADLRFGLASNAQKKIRAQYSTEMLRQQVWEISRQAHRNREFNRSAGGAAPRSATVL
jgi:hypothetical protein